jgi:hypothetical protein
MTTLQVGNHVKEISSGRTGRVLRIFDIDNQGNLAVIRLDQGDPLYGSVTCAFEGEVEILMQAHDLTKGDSE